MKIGIVFIFLLLFSCVNIETEVSCFNETNNFLADLINQEKLIVDINQDCITPLELPSDYELHPISKFDPTNSSHYELSYTKKQSDYLSNLEDNSLIHINRFPYPYNSVLLITHDVDSIDAYEEGIHLFQKNEQNNGVKATYFFTVWDFLDINEDYWAKDPDYQGIIWQPKEIRNFSSDIGSHSRHHYKTAYLQNITLNEFIENELIYSKEVIEYTTQKEIISYRSPYLAVRVDYLFEGLMEAGYKVDLSLTDFENQQCMPRYYQDILEIYTAIPDDSILFFNRHQDNLLNGTKDGKKYLLKKLDATRRYGCVFNFLIHPSKGGFNSIEEKWEIEKALIDKARDLESVWITDVKTFYYWWETRQKLIFEKNKDGILLKNPTNLLIENVVVNIYGTKSVVNVSAGESIIFN